MQQRKIRTLYVVHHSHTDIGYTDLQERVINMQKDYIRSALFYGKKQDFAGFRWNCETLFCVEQFLHDADEEERAEFLKQVAGGTIGLSANYLNFTDLLDCEVFSERTREWAGYFRAHGVPFRTAMFADINGVTMGYRDALIENGIEFLYTNIHSHHGMYPLYQNQTPFYWENSEGGRILVWNGDNYYLGNELGLHPDVTFSCAKDGGVEQYTPGTEETEAAHQKIAKYLSSCEEQGYPYDFIIASVSGVFTDNAPPNPGILKKIGALNSLCGAEIQIRMVTLPELYDAIRDKVQNAPVFHGDFTDWWASGVGSTPYAVKHYLAARRRYHLCERLEPDLETKYPEEVRTAQDNLLLYAEHTWGHSNTVSYPYDTMVLDQDIRKTSYASRAHEAASRMLDSIVREKGDILRYYALHGKIKVINVSGMEADMPVEFYVENRDKLVIGVTDTEGNRIESQMSAHPRGKKITFVDHFLPGEVKEYGYEKITVQPEEINPRKCYIGAEMVKDIVNDYDPESCKLPFSYENSFFHMEYAPYRGILSLTDRRNGRELSGREEAPLFTPIYELTKIGERHEWYETDTEHERRMLGRNIRGTRARHFIGELEDVKVEERGPVFTLLRFVYSLPGTEHADVLLKFYEALPRVDIRFEIAKTLPAGIESVYLPLGVNIPDGKIYLKKGREAFRPGIDQIPGTCMEYYASDDGYVCLSGNGSVAVAARDTPLFCMGRLSNHPIRLCDGKEENNHRPVYSWVMNNLWETNFKMDLSGYSEFDYSLWLIGDTNPEMAMNDLHNRTFDPCVLIIS